MTWEAALFAFLDDLEGQAQGVFDADRQLEVADRARGEYASVTVASRLMASVGRTLNVRVRGAGLLEGRLAAVGTGWCLLESGAQEWIVRQEAIATVAGVSERSVPKDAWPVTARLGWASMLRRIAEAGDSCHLRLLGSEDHHVVPTRVGQDFLEARLGARQELMLFPFDAMAAVHSRP